MYQLELDLSQNVGITTRSKLQGTCNLSAECIVFIVWFNSLKWSTKAWWQGFATRNFRM